MPLQYILYVEKKIFTLSTEFDAEILLNVWWYLEFFSPHGVLSNLVLRCHIARGQGLGPT